MPDANERESRSITLQGLHSLRPRAQRPHRAAEPTPLRCRGCAAGVPRRAGREQCRRAAPPRAAARGQLRPNAASARRGPGRRALRSVRRAGPASAWRRAVPAAPGPRHARGSAVPDPTLRPRTRNNSILPFFQSWKRDRAWQSAFRRRFRPALRTATAGRSHRRAALPRSAQPASSRSGRQAELPAQLRGAVRQQSAGRCPRSPRSPPGTAHKHGLQPGQLLSF